MAASIESISKQLFILFLGSPEAVTHRIQHILVVPGLNHEVSYTCDMVSVGLRACSTGYEDNNDRLFKNPTSSISLH